MKNNVKIIYKEQDIFPENLKSIKKFPNKLYAIGNIQLLKSDGIAVIGSRECSDYGLRIAEKFAYELSQKGITIVSGMAIGIDTAAHTGAIKSTGKTIAVLGGGFNNIFPVENTELFHNIINSGGLVITEYEPNEEAKSRNFPIRNRIISGLSLGVLVVEAGYRSGASLTANIAIQQGKPVFCIPSNIDNKYNRTNELIKNGAKLITATDEIIKECSIKLKEAKLMETEFNNNVIVKNKKMKIDNNIPSEYKKIYKILSYEPMHINEIQKRSEDDIANIINILTMLELEDKIEQLPGKMFKII